MATFFDKQSGKAERTNEQIQEKKQQLKQLAEEAKQLKNELVEAGAWPLSDDDLDEVAGGYPFFRGFRMSKTSNSKS